MRLYDRIQKGFGWWNEDGTPGFTNESHFPNDAVRVDITNVHHYLMEHPSDDWPVDTFPNLAPPWQNAWFEYALAREANVNGKTVTIQTGRDGVHVGFLMESLELPSDGGWGLKWTLFVWTDPNAAPTYLGHLSHFVDRQGRYVGGHDARSTIYAFMPLSSHVDPRETKEALDSWVKNCYLALSFAHCKNVKIQEHHTPPKVAAKRKKAGKPPGTSYKTLLIDPMKEVLRTEGNIEKNGLKKALHIVRGHFATYTEDKPLFGKVTGTFWKPMHARGNKKHGEIKKDYVIGAPD